MLADKTIISLRFEDGSIGVINYLANGHKKVPKERLEIFTVGVIQLDNFIKLKAFGWKNFKGKDFGNRIKDNGHVHENL